jgi:hypothetical protein
MALDAHRMLTATITAMNDLIISVSPHLVVMAKTLDGIFETKHQMLRQAELRPVTCESFCLGSAR